MITTKAVSIEGFHSTTSDLPTKNHQTMPFLVATDRAAREEVQHRAYTIWQNSGEKDGHDVENWLKAELEVAPRAAETPPAVI